MTLEYVLSIMLGQVWSQTGYQALSDLIKAERDLFKNWWRQGHQGFHTFSQLYLWSMGERIVDLLVIKEYLHQMIVDQDQIQEIILHCGKIVLSLRRQLSNCICIAILSNTRLISGKN